MAQAATRERSPGPGAKGKADRELKLVRRLPAKPEQVFRAFADPRRLVKWWGPKGVTIPVCEMDVRPGGRWLTTMRSSDGDMTVSGVYREIDPPSRLVFTWAWHGDGKRGHETLVTIALKPHGAGTELTLTQGAFDSAQSLDAHRHGWSSSFDCLAEYLRG
ncbi:MAG TPA: SRPBCC domain-containing protein [Alphaproteobacteria bacterium]